MTKLEELRTALKSMITDKTSPEDAEKIGGLNKIVDDIEKEEASLLESHDNLRKKYIEAVRNTSFPVDKEDHKEESENKSFEEILQEKINAKEKK